ncbi:MAG: DUF5688 family protein [Erysipelotrichaceae bacterium]|nr:DUF5688 family protein [Erysipelotrichaceae bacterium]
MNDISFEEFRELLNKRLNEEPEIGKSIEVSNRPIQKLTGNYVAISLYDAERNVGLTANPHNLYKEFRNGRSVDRIVANMMEQMADPPNVGDMERLCDLEQIRDHIFIRVSNAKRNEELLKTVPHQIEGEFAITYHVLMYDDGEALGNAMITNLIMSAYGIDQKKLHEIAMENSPGLFPAALYELGIRGEPGNLICATNMKKINGAAVMFYPGMIETILKKFDEDFYVIPSSIHEMMLIPERVASSVEHMLETLHDANIHFVEEGEDLSENIYFISGSEPYLKRITD